MVIKEIHLNTYDLPGTKKFYGGLMEFNLSEQNNHSFSFFAGNTLVYFHESNLSRPVYHFAFHIPNNKLQEALEWVSKRTPILPYLNGLIADFTNWNAQSFYFHDNNLNILEFITHYDRLIESTAKFNILSINHIIEIGLPVDEVYKACSDLITNYAIEYFYKGPVTKNFAVMGNENGMLIITKKNRTWLPTQQRAEIFDLKIVMEINGVINVVYQNNHTPDKSFN